MYRLCLLVLLGVWHASAQLTTPAPGSSVTCNTVGIQNCGKCDLPGMTCAYCAANYVLASDYKSCIACDVNCVNCVLDSTGKIGMCQMCAPGYTVRTDGTCGSCGSLCATCVYTDTAQTITKCTMCTPAPAGWPAYLLGSVSNQCQDCTQVTTGCATCSEASDKTLSCGSCQTRFFGVVNGGIRTCMGCPNYCLTCTLAANAVSINTCGTCQTNYVANSAASPIVACLYCDPTKCAKCTTTAVTSSQSIAQCGSCQKGYYLDASNICQACPIGCATCTSATACQTCVSTGYWLNSAASTCTPCSIGCNTCSFSTGVETCSACTANYGVQSTQNSCNACPAFCTSCTDPQTCTGCTLTDPVFDYALVSINGGVFCKVCPLNCFSCADNSMGQAVCTTCNDGYQAAFDINGNSVCYPCGSHCSACSIDPNTYLPTCTLCEKDASGNDYYLNANNMCVSCTSQCTDCTGSGNACLACQSTYFVDSSLSASNPRCTKCASQNCIACNFAGNCTTCAPGFYLDANSVCSEACDTNCICTVATPTCTACLKTPTVAPFNFFAAAACDFCDIKCTSAGCGAGGVCSACVSGYVPDTNAAPNAGLTCVKCDPNCDLTVAGSCTATGTTMKCTACVAGYYVNGNACSKCSTAGCSLCTGNVCSACFSTYTSNGASPVVCLANDAHCATGNSIYDSTAKKVKCTLCTGLYTAGTPGACLPNPTGCDTGMLDNTDTTGTTVLCSVCSTGYGITSKNLCKACPANCATCSPDASDNEICNGCNNLYAQNVFACGKCPPGCTACKNVLGTMVCSQCSSQGYYLANGACTACTSCTSCSASGCNAGTCVAGYGLATNLACTTCSTLTGVNGCTNCTDADTTGFARCLACGQGQVLDGWGANCVDASSLTNCVQPEYRPYECTPGSCNSPFSWVTMGPGRGQCGLTCATCGNIDAGIFLPASQCQNSNNNYTQTQVVGACWVVRTVDANGNALYARGGTSYTFANCTGATQVEFLLSTSPRTTVKCCQTGNNCNSNILLDGVAGASATSFSLALLFASICMAVLRFF